MMADPVILIQLATRIPKDLHRRLKLVAVRQEKSVMVIVVEALGMWLEKQGKKN